MGFVILSKSKKVKKFVKQAYKLVSASMNIPLKKFPHFIHVDVSSKKFKNVCDKLGLNKLFENVNVKSILQGHRKINASFYVNDNVILINELTINADELGFALGEELFHFVYEYYNPVEKDDLEDLSFTEFFGYAGRHFLFNLFIRYREKDYYEFFKDKSLLRELRTWDMKKLIKDLNKGLEQLSVDAKQLFSKDKATDFLKSFAQLYTASDHLPDYNLAKLFFIKHRWPLLDLAVDDPKNFFTSDPIKIKELVDDWSKMTFGQRLERITERHKEILKKL